MNPEEQARQSIDRLRMTTATPSAHHVAVPAHDPLEVGTLAGILGDVADHMKLSRDELLQRLFG